MGACRSIVGEVESKIENASWCTQLKQKIQEFHAEAKQDLKRDQRECSFDEGKPSGGAKRTMTKSRDKKAKKKKQNEESESDSKETGVLNNPLENVQMFKKALKTIQSRETN